MSDHCPSCSLIEIFHSSISFPVPSRRLLREISHGRAYRFVSFRHDAPGYLDGRPSGWPSFSFEDLFQAFRPVIFLGSLGHFQVLDVPGFFLTPLSRAVRPWSSGFSSLQILQTSPLFFPFLWFFPFSNFRRFCFPALRSRTTPRRVGSFYEPLMSSVVLLFLINSRIGDSLPSVLLPTQRSSRKCIRSPFCNPPRLERCRSLFCLPLPSLDLLLFCF